MPQTLTHNKNNSTITNYFKVCHVSFFLTKGLLLLLLLGL